MGCSYALTNRCFPPRPGVKMALVSAIMYIELIYNHALVLSYWQIAIFLLVYVHSCLNEKRHLPYRSDLKPVLSWEAGFRLLFVWEVTYSDEGDILGVCEIYVAGHLTPCAHLSDLNNVTVTSMFANTIVYVYFFSYSNILYTSLQGLPLSKI